MDSYDLDINQGETFVLSLTLRDENSAPIDLTNYSLGGNLKYQYGDSYYLSSLNAVKNTPYASGIVSFSIDATGTAILPVTLGVYDVFISNSCITTKILNGNANINPSVM